MNKFSTPPRECKRELLTRLFKVLIESKEGDEEDNKVCKSKDHIDNWQAKAKLIINL